MPTPRRRRWFSLSLRTLLIGITLLSVLFAWFLHHRRMKIAERDRLLEEYQRGESYGSHREGASVVDAPAARRSVLIPLPRDDRRLCGIGLSPQRQPGMPPAQQPRSPFLKSLR